MKPQIKVILISLLFYLVIYILIISIVSLVTKEQTALIAGITAAVTAGITMLIAPRTKKIKLQSGEKIIITNDLFNLFKRQNS